MQKRRNEPRAAAGSEQKPGQEAGNPEQGDPQELRRLEDQDASRAEAEQEAGIALAEPAGEAIARLERELADWKDRALRAAADLENFRRRSVRERDDARNRGQTEVLARVIDVIDDLARVAHLDPGATDAQALHDGMLAIERKFLKALELAGVERIDPQGEAFDPNCHEAVASLPAPAAEADHTVGAVYSHGYRLRGMLLRPARVAVLQWQPEAGVTAPGPVPDDQS